MATKFPGLDELLSHDGNAKKLYESLPGYVRDAIHERAYAMKTFDTLRRYADNLLAGDD